MTTRTIRIKGKLDTAEDPDEIAALKAKLQAEMDRPARVAKFDPPLERKRLTVLNLDRETELAIEFLEGHRFEDGRPRELSEIRRQALCHYARHLGWEPSE